MSRLQTYRQVYVWAILTADKPKGQRVLLLSCGHWAFDHGQRTVFGLAMGGTDVEDAVYCPNCPAELVDK